MYNSKYCYTFGGMKRKISKETNRSEGWKGAKASGHLNEKLVAEKMNDGVTNVYSCGFSKVSSILDRKTPSKPDIIIDSKGRIRRRSLKKSFTGQVHMNSVDIFSRGFEVKYEKVPDKIRESLKLIFGGSKLSWDILQDSKFIHMDQKIRNMELRRKTLCFETFRKFDESAFNDLIKWFRNNIQQIATIIFQTGWASEQENHADELWYKNLVDEGCSFDQVFDIDQIIEKSLSKKDQIYPKTKNGGTVINLPFGWVQYHQGQMQFHHSLKQISELFVD